MSNLIRRILNAARPEARLLRASPPLEGRFLNILLDTTSACNMTCRMCWQSIPLADGVSPKPQELGLDLMRRFTDEVVPHASSINFSCMAEPFMNRRFGDFLDMLGRAELPYTTIVTNGMILPDAMIERVIAAKIAKLTLSVDSAEKENFEFIRRGGDFERIAQNFRRLKAFKEKRGLSTPVLQVNCILMKRNIRELVRIVELAAELGAAEFHVRHVIPIDGLDMLDQSLWDEQELADECVRGGAKRAAELNLKMPTVPLFSGAARSNGEGAIQRMKSRLKKAAKKYVQINWMKPRCAQPWRNITLHPNGDVYPCNNWVYDPSTRGAALLFPPPEGTTSVAEDFRMGNLNSQTFGEIWNGEKFVNLRRGLLGERPMEDICRKCPLRLGQDCEVYSPKKEMVDQERDWSKAKAAGDPAGAGGKA